MQSPNLSKHGHSAALLIPMLMVLLLSSSCGGQDSASRLALDDANYQLKKFEAYTAGLNGKMGVVTRGTKETLKKIIELRKQFPNDPRVNKLYDRAQVSIRLLKGDRLEITPEMLDYRDRESQRIALVAKTNRQEWFEFQSKLLAENIDAIVNPFPAKSVDHTPLKQIKGRYVFLDGIEYPEGIFTHYGQPYVAVGTPATGFYFIDCSQPSFIGAYAAVRRYQRNVSNQLPKKWKMIGRVTGSKLLVPYGGRNKKGQAFAGWVVSVEAIYIPDRVLAMHDSKDERGGFFAGEDSMQESMAALYTVQSLPEKYEPNELLQTFVTAIKEKNFQLYQSCIHPEEQETHIQKNWIERKWDMLQRRFESEIVAVRIGKQDAVKVLSGGGGDDANDLLGEFLDGSEVSEITDDGAQRSEKLTLWLKLYNETGRITEYQKPLTLKRDGDVEGFRWFIKSGFPF